MSALLAFALAQPFLFQAKLAGGSGPTSFKITIAGEREDQIRQARIAGVMTFPSAVIERRDALNRAYEERKARIKRETGHSFTACGPIPVWVLFALGSVISKEKLRFVLCGVDPDGTLILDAKLDWTRGDWLSEDLLESGHFKANARDTWRRASLVAKEFRARTQATGLWYVEAGMVPPP